MASETVDALLVIADIGGYTRFMKMHRTSLAHAQENTSRLLEAIIDAAPDLELSGLEGDAAFLYATRPTADEITRSLAGLASAMHRAFHDEQRRLEVLRVFWCDGCKQTGQLTVKVVAHYGETVVSTTRGRSTLAGLDVILVHRMLKNSVPISEYVLMTDAVLERAGPPIADLTSPIEEELEGLGSQRLHYADMAQLAGPESTPPNVSLFERAASTGSLMARGLPYYVGLKKSEVTVER
jgi:uncharacterized protein DUF2652